MTGSHRPGGDNLRRWRTVLITPGERVDRLVKAFAVGPDVVVADLEDAVAPSKKADARASVAEALRAAPRTGVGRLVRVNPVAAGGLLADDLAAVVSGALDGVMLAKTRAPHDIAVLDAMLAEREAAAGLPPGSIAIVPLIEDAGALRQVFDIARASDRIAAMSFAGAEQGDFMADIGGIWTPDGMALHYAKSRFLVEVRAASGVPAVDGPSMHLDEPVVLQSEARISRTLGFDGKVAIHPHQLDVIRAQFVPSADEVRRAEEVVRRVDEAREAGRGVGLADGVMVDEANARTARRVLARRDDASEIEETKDHG